eukprot:359263-Chlamydomonas_euryale.AAC.3
MQIWHVLGAALAAAWPKDVRELVACNSSWRATTLASRGAYIPRASSAAPTDVQLAILASARLLEAPHVQPCRLH